MFDFSTVDLSHLATYTPPPPLPPPPAPAPAAAAPALAGDAVDVGENAGLMSAAAAFDFGPLPFDANGFVGPVLPPGQPAFADVPTVGELPEGPLKEAAIATATAIVQASGESNQALIDSLRGTFSDQGLADLEALHADGRLDAPDPAGGPNLRDSLAGFLNGGGDVATAEALVRQVAAPDTISQICNNTCAASTAQAGWAYNRPAEYFRAAADLATKGEATITRDGRPVTLQVDEGGKYAMTRNREAIAAAGLGGVDRVDASVQAALMNMGSNGAYDLRQDKVLSTMDLGWELGGSITIPFTGLSLNDSQGLFQALLQTPFAAGWSVNHSEGGTTFHRDAAGEFATMKAQLEAGAKGAFTLVGTGARNQGPAAEATGHAVAVVAIKDGQVSYFDPQGHMQAATEEAFVAMMGAVDYNDVLVAGIGGSGGYGTGGAYVARYPARPR